MQIWKNCLTRKIWNKLQTRSNEKGVDKSIKTRKMLYECDERERERVTTETLVAVKH